MTTKEKAIPRETDAKVSNDKARAMFGEFLPIKVIGNPPAPRFGHTLNYLPSNNSLLVAGGKLTTLFLQFIFLFNFIAKVATMTCAS